MAPIRIEMSKGSLVTRILRAIESLSINTNVTASVPDLGGVIMIGEHETPQGIRKDVHIPFLDDLYPDDYQDSVLGKDWKMAMRVRGALVSAFDADGNQFDCTCGLKAQPFKRLPGKHLLVLKSHPIEPKEGARACINTPGKHEVKVGVELGLDLKRRPVDIVKDLHMF